MPAQTIEERLQRVEDFQQIQNIMGRYAYYVMAGMQDEIDDKLFAQKTPGVRVYYGEQGYCEGLDGPKRIRAEFVAQLSEEERQQMRAGIMAIHAPICPVIEVAGDGKTAKGVWIGLGLLCMKDRETGEPNGAWEWDKYGVDFVKEDGKWKIWHHHIYRLIHGWGVDEKWAEQFSKPDPPRRMKVDGPPVDDNPYRPDTVQRLVPKPPDPYETWEDTTSY